MLSPRLVVAALLSVLTGACAHDARPVTAAQTRAAAQDEDRYVTITPHVSVSRSAEEMEQPRAALDPNADVMAEILAIPPGG
jgi:glucose/arabinose dehydrogenase